MGWTGKQGGVNVAGQQGGGVELTSEPGSRETNQRHSPPYSPDIFSTCSDRRQKPKHVSYPALKIQELASRNISTRGPERWLACQPSCSSPISNLVLESTGLSDLTLQRSWAQICHSPLPRLDRSFLCLASDFCCAAAESAFDPPGLRLPLQQPLPPPLSPRIPSSSSREPDPLSAGLMYDVTIGRRAGAGMIQMKQRQEGSPRRVGRGAGQQGQRGSQDEADQVSSSIAIAVEVAHDGIRGKEDACPSSRRLCWR